MEDIQEKIQMCLWALTIVAALLFIVICFRIWIWCKINAIRKKRSQ